jgi:DNA replication protein DnaC
MLNHWETLEHQAMQEQWSYAQFLLALCETEIERRWSQRLKRGLTEAQLPSAKTLATFDWSHLKDFNPAPLMQLTTDSGWLKRAENCLMFGPSGVGKTHLACAVARATVELGYRAKFFAATTLVQTLQHAKRQLLLPNTLKKLDRYFECQEAGLNRRHEDFQSSALPAELSRLGYVGSRTVVAPCRCQIR